MLTSLQETNLKFRQNIYLNKIKPKKKYKYYEIVLLLLADRPNEWFATWELMGETKYGFLSHASHAILRKLEQEGKIVKAYVGPYVVYSHKH